MCIYEVLVKIKACHMRQALAQCLLPDKDSIDDRYCICIIYIQALQMSSTCYFWVRDIEGQWSFWHYLH